jgi:TatA/E family protein of Tat protein translocase
MSELRVILVLGVVLFGAKKVPDLGEGQGDGIRNFRASLKGKDGRLREKRVAFTSRPPERRPRIVFAKIASLAEEVRGPVFRVPISDNPGRWSAILTS